VDARRWKVIDSVYHAILEKEPGERSSCLEAACAEQRSLRREIESLLAYADLQLAGPVEPAEVAKLWDQIAGDVRNGSPLPANIGQYRILRLLGEGGMGTVYEAEQEQPRRIVALKVIKPGLTNPEVLRRFQQECQALARLQHPGIAQVYEAGTPRIAEQDRSPILQWSSSGADRYWTTSARII
jgi:serine/threonine protein kinase